jgi:hypothetical protein
MSGCEVQAESGLRTWKTYCPEDAEERSTAVSNDVTPSLREATVVVVKTAPPEVVETRIS